MTSNALASSSLTNSLNGGAKTLLDPLLGNGTDVSLSLVVSSAPPPNAECTLGPLSPEAHAYHATGIDVSDLLEPPLEMPDQSFRSNEAVLHPGTIRMFDDPSKSSSVARPVVRRGLTL